MNSKYISKKRGHALAKYFFYVVIPILLSYYNCLKNYHSFVLFSNTYLNEKRLYWFNKRSLLNALGTRVIIKSLNELI